MEDMAELSYRPLSVQAFGELNALQSWMQDNPLSDHNDVWIYSWGEKCADAKFYESIHAHITVPKVYHWLWKSSCVMTSKVFAWLLLKDRQNTKDMLQRRHWNVVEQSHCVLCPLRVHEDRAHLFFQCNFNQRIWNYLQIQWIAHDDLQTVVTEARRSFGQPFFMEVVIMACRNIWLLRNAKIFRQEIPTFAKWKCNFVHSISLLKYRIKPKLLDSLSEWIDSLP
jgi:hypothetical protein